MSSYVLRSKENCLDNKIPTFQDVLLSVIPEDVFIFIREDNEGLDHLASVRVRAGNHGRLLDGLVFYQGGLHLEGSNPVARGDDEIVLPGEEPEVTVLILNAAVSSEVVITTEGIGRGCGILTVTLLRYIGQV